MFVCVIVLFFANLARFEFFQIFPPSIPVSFLSLNFFEFFFCAIFYLLHFFVLGWEEGFRYEKDCLLQQMRMSREEVRLLKVDVRKRYQELFAFYLVRIILLCFFNLFCGDSDRKKNEIKIVLKFFFHFFKMHILIFHIYSNSSKLSNF